MISYILEKEGKIYKFLFYYLISINIQKLRNYRSNKDFTIIIIKMKTKIILIFSISSFIVSTNNGFFQTISEKNGGKKPSFINFIPFKVWE